MRLVGFQRVALQPGRSQRVIVITDPRLPGRFDGNAGYWRIAAALSRGACRGFGGARVRSVVALWQWAP
jgi:hypothetical protein